MDRKSLKFKNKELYLQVGQYKNNGNIAILAYTKDEFYGDIPIFIYSSKSLSKEQKREIFSAVKDGIRHNDIAEKISVEIMRRTRIMKIPSVKKTSEFISVTI